MEGEKRYSPKNKTTVENAKKVPYEYVGKQKIYLEFDNWQKREEAMAVIIKLKEKNPELFKRLFGGLEFIKIDEKREAGLSLSFDTYLDKRSEEISNYLEENRVKLSKKTNGETEIYDLPMAA